MRPFYISPEIYCEMCVCASIYIIPAPAPELIAPAAADNNAERPARHNAVPTFLACKCL